MNIIDEIEKKNLKMKSIHSVINYTCQIYEVVIYLKFIEI